VLENLNLDIGDGEFLVLLGSSGCGKSTLLNCIAGLLEPTDGQIFIKGKNVTWEEPKDRGIGMVFQSYALYPQMTVEKNLSFGLQVAKMPKPEIDKRVARAAEILQIRPAAQAQALGALRRPAPARGDRARIGARCRRLPVRRAAVQPRRQTALGIARRNQAAAPALKNTMIYVTHDQIEALTLADRIAIMKSGVIQQLADPNTIYNVPKNLFVAGFIGSPSMNFLKGEIAERGRQGFSERRGLLARRLQGERTAPAWPQGGARRAAGTYEGQR
jgi:multiple sugar transport system ATP-binding protein